MARAVLFSRCSALNRARTGTPSFATADNGFTDLGITLADKRIIVVKSMQHFMAGFGDLASDVLYVTTPGAIPPEFDGLPYTKRAGPFWPKVNDPFAA